MYKLSSATDGIIDVPLDLFNRAFMDEGSMCPKMNFNGAFCLLPGCMDTHVSSFKPSPTRNDATFSANFDAKSAYTDACTYILLAQTHVWPDPLNLQAMAPNGRKVE